jgi:hypothetical protein
MRALTSRESTLWQWIDVSIGIGDHMLDDMGIFRTTVAVAALSAPDDRRVPISDCGFVFRSVFLPGHSVL